MEHKRVVVTGIGVISPVGLTLADAWRNLTLGSSGVRAISLFDPAGFDVRIAGEAHGFNPENYMPARDARRMDRFTQFAIAALEEAQSQAKLAVDERNNLQIGVVIGSGVGGIDTYTGELNILNEKGPRRVSPFLIPSITVDVPAVQVAIRTGARGPNFGVASACSTGADAIGQAFEMIRSGGALAVFTGGFEAAVTPIGVAAFDRMRALSHRNDEPKKASRPFDAGRDGFVMGEGGALLVLEELEFALRRGAEPLAELAAYAATSDAVHLAAPDLSGAGMASCIRMTLERAGLDPSELSYINAHGPSTTNGDLAETNAIKDAIGPDARRVPISSTKSMTGHMLGGAGAFESAVCIQAMRMGIVPPTINLDEPDPLCDLDYVPNESRRVDVGTALSISMGFGGHNAALVFRKYPPER